jgi:hypothetical protein
MTSSDDKKASSDPTPSICEEALEEYRNAEDTFAGLIESNHIEIRDFMILSFVCDQGAMTVDRIKSVLGLSNESAMSCIARLRDIDLISFDIESATGLISSSITPTGIGRSVASRIHSKVDRE